MKRIIDLGTEFILESMTHPKRDALGNVVWTDYENCVAEVANLVRGVKFYLPTGTDGNFFEVSLTAHQIKQLAKAIVEIECEKREPEFVEE